MAISRVASRISVIQSLCNVQYKRNLARGGKRVYGVLTFDRAGNVSPSRVLGWRETEKNGLCMYRTRMCRL